MVGIMLMMGNLGFPRLRLYWDPLFRIPLIADNMQINRFFKLRQSLHVGVKYCLMLKQTDFGRSGLFMTASEHAVYSFRLKVTFALMSKWYPSKAALVQSSMWQISQHLGE